MSLLAPALPLKLPLLGTVQWCCRRHWHSGWFGNVSRLIMNVTVVDHVPFFDGGGISARSATYSTVQTPDTDCVCHTDTSCHLPPARPVCIDQAGALTPGCCRRLLSHTFSSFWTVRGRHASGPQDHSHCQRERGI